MAKQPVEFMFSPYRRQVLATLFLRPDERFHVRELERMTGVSAGSLHRELRAMARIRAISARKGRKSGLLSSKPRVFNIRRTRSDFSQDDRADVVAAGCLVGLRRKNSRSLRLRIDGQRPPKRRQRPRHLRARRSLAVGSRDCVVRSPGNRATGSKPGRHDDNEVLELGGQGRPLRDSRIGRTETVCEGERG